MEYLFAGEERHLHTSARISRIGRYIARSISIGPIVLATITGLISLGTVRLFQHDNNLATDVPDISADADNAISLLLSIIFSVELVRLLGVSDARHKLAMHSHKLTHAQRNFFTDISVGYDTRGANNPFLLPDPSTATDFITAVYTMAGLNRLPSATHLRWALFDLTMLYHAFVRTYVLAATDPSNTFVFTFTFIRSYLHYVGLMLMFSTSDSIFQYYTIDRISKNLPVPVKNLYMCLDKWLTDQGTTVFGDLRYTIQDTGSYSA